MSTVHSASITLIFSTIPLFLLYSTSTFALPPPLYLGENQSHERTSSQDKEVARRQDAIPVTDQRPDSDSASPAPTVTPTPSATESSNGAQGSSSSGVSMEVIIPVVVLLVSAVVLVIFVHWRAPIKRFIKSHLNIPSSSSTALRPTSTQNSDSERRTLTAEQLSGHRNGNGNGRRRGRERTGTTTTGTGTDGTGNANLSARERNRRERERNVRRTESGRSVRTLPVYSKEAGDEELVLVRQHSQSSFSDDSYSDQDTTDPLTDAERGLLPRSHSVRSTISRHRGEATSDEPSLSTVREQDDTQSIEHLRTPSPTSAGLAQDTNSPLNMGNESEGGTPHSAPLESSSQPEIPRRTDSIARRGWGEAPTYLEAMSSPFPPSPSPLDTSASAEVPPPRGLRTRTSSTFRGLLSRAGFTNVPFLQDQPMTQRQHASRTSSTSLLLQPTSSRISATSSFLQPISPQIIPMTSTLSLISGPLPNTAVRASFDSTHLPRAGLSDDQMRFLGSKEALTVAGVKMGEVPEQRKRRRRSEALSVDGFGPRVGDGEGEGEGESSRRGSAGSASAGSPSIGGTGDGDGDRRGSEGGGGEQEAVLPPSWEQSEEQRRRNDAFERRNLARPVEVKGNPPEADGAAGAEVEADAEAEAEVVIEDGVGAGAEGGKETPTAMTNMTGLSSLQIPSKLAPAPTPTPTLEIEPPTPIVSTPPPPPPLAAASAIA